LSFSFIPYQFSQLFTSFIRNPYFAVIVIKARKDDFTEDEVDENGTVIDDGDMSWVDTTIVVEDGFKDGEKVIGEFVLEDETAVFFEDEE
jgi:hypothetical protein